MLALCLTPCVCIAQERALAPLTAWEPRSCVLSGQKVNFTYLAADTRTAAWQVEWSLTADHRTLRQGHSEARLAPDSEVPTLMVELTVPDLREGVVLPVQLKLNWQSNRVSFQEARELFIYSSDPFSSRQEFLKNAQLKLFDPEDETAELFDRYEIPYSRLLNLSAIDLVGEGVVFVGEGVSLREQRRLVETLVRAAGRGVPLVCLAPAEGDFPLSLLESNEPPRPVKLSLERADVVRRYDKRFDLLPTVCSLSLEPRRNDVVVTAGDGGDDWAWLELEFPPAERSRSPGKFIVCGLGLVSDWETGPVPRYLFLNLLDRLTASVSAKENEDEFMQR